LRSQARRLRTAGEVDEDLVLLEAVLARDEQSWLTLVRRFDPELRALIGDGTELTFSQVDDVIGDLWLLLVDDDMRRLRAYAASKRASLGAWLAMQATQVAFAHQQKLRDEPKMVPLEEAPEIADPRQPTMTPKMMKVEQVAERWDLNPKTVYAMIERGELAARRCGRVIRVPRHVVESFEQASVAPDRSKKPCR